MKVSALLIRGGDLYAPRPLGQVDVLMVHDRVAAIGSHLSLPEWAEGTIIEAAGRVILPGFVDQHVHIAGGGGEGGPQYRTPELSLTDLTTHGVTCAVGVLGTDGTTRSVQGLLAKARALAIEGITAWIYTGAYQVPTRTITDSARADIVLVDRVVGVGEIAISDQRGSHPSDRELGQLASEAWVGGLLTGKAGVLHLHVGEGKRMLDPLFEIMEMADIPIDTLVPTHLNRKRDLLEDAIRFGLRGGHLDITTSIVPEPGDRAAVAPVEAVEKLRSSGVAYDRITFSTDAGGSAPIFNSRGEIIKMGIGSPKSLWESVRGLHDELGLDWSEAVMPATLHPATLLKFDDVGRIAVGCQGDLVISDGQVITDVIARGRVMVRNGKPSVFGIYEGDS